MSDKLHEAAAILATILRSPQIVPSHVPGVTLFRCDAAEPDFIYVTKPTASFILQGRKQTIAGGITTTFSAGQYLVIGGRMPGHCTIISPCHSTPFLCLSVELDPALLARLFLELPEEPAPESCPAVLEGRISETMEDALLRLMQAAANPTAAPFMGPLICKELHYFLATGDLRASLRSLSEANTVPNRILRVVNEIQTHCEAPLDLKALAQRIGMSLSVFHRKFKETTGLSPIQFQKRLRLFSAQERMIAQGMRVSEAANSVGYENVSQFSREYTRQFGLPPLKDVQQRRARLQSMAPNSAAKASSAA